MKHKRATFRRRRNIDHNLVYRVARDIRAQREQPQRKLIGADKERFMAAARLRDMREAKRAAVWNGARA